LAHHFVSTSSISGKLDFANVFLYIYFCSFFGFLNIYQLFLFVLL